jgi:hypothetical protein
VESFKPAGETAKSKGEQAVSTLEPKKKKAPARAKKVSRKAELSPESYVIIDHPQDGDLVSGLVYTVRIGASSNGTVELSIDGGDWQPCRFAAGYWWFDWGWYTPGSHSLCARLRDDAGNTISESAPVKCEVV